MGASRGKQHPQGQPRAYLAVVQKTGGCRGADMPTGTRIAFAGTEVAWSRCSGPVCVTALQDLVPFLKRMDLLLERDETPAPSERIICTGCRNHYRAVELELAYLPHGFEGDPDDDATLARTIEALRASPLTAALPSATIERIARACGRADVAPGDVLIRQGTEGTTLYLVEEGSVDVSIRKGSKSTRVATLGPGACVGEMSLLTGQPASASVIAAAPTRVLTLGKGAFHSLLLQNPGMNVYFAQLLVERIQANQRLLAEGVKSGMSGELATMSPSQILQALHSARCTGRVTLTSGERAVAVFFGEGELYRVSPIRDVNPDQEAAFYELLAWTEGTFAFEASETPVERTFFKNLLALMLEGTRRFDERRIATS